MEPHSAGDDDAVPHTYPGGHWRHAPMDAPPVTGLYVPAGQGMDFEDVDAIKHMYPASHAPEQSIVPAPAAPYVPAGQGVCVGLVLPLPHQYPALHTSVHADDDNPVVPPYRPLVQSVQADTSPPPVVGEYVPDGHGTAVLLVLPTGQ